MLGSSRDSHANGRDFGEFEGLRRVILARPSRCVRNSLQRNDLVSCEESISGSSRSNENLHWAKASGTTAFVGGAVSVDVNPLIDTTTGKLYAQKPPRLRRVRRGAAQLRFTRYVQSVFGHFTKSYLINRGVASPLHVNILSEIVLFREDRPASLAAMRCAAPGFPTLRGMLKFVVHCQGSPFPEGPPQSLG